MAAAAAVGAAAAGVAVGFFLISGAPSASVFTGAAPGISASPSVSVPARAGQLRVALTGRVLAVSGTSITIGGAGPSVTAAITTGTRVTGRAHSVGGIKGGGDHVAAQLAGTAAELTGTATHLTAGMGGTPGWAARRDGRARRGAAARIAGRTEVRRAGAGDRGRRRAG